jgi:hypothetical protein
VEGWVFSASDFAGLAVEGTGQTALAAVDAVSSLHDFFYECYDSAIRN